MDKTCNVCGLAKDIEQFYRAPLAPDGYAAACRKCTRAASRQRTDDRKFCPRCSRWKSIDDFPRNRMRADGRGSYCRDCANTYAAGYYRAKAHDAIVSRVYRMSRGGYAEMFDRQDGVCAICQQAEVATLGGKVKRLAVDHDHETGGVRSLLCSRCNTIIGRADDDVELLAAAIEYVLWWRENPSSPVPFERARVAQCGTYGGSLAHYRRGEKPCDLCRAARRRYDAEFRERQRAKKALDQGDNQ